MISSSTANKGCNGFSFMGAACYLKKGITKFVPKPGVVSAMTKKDGGRVAVAQQQRGPPVTVQKVVSP